jgi:hypothetical protein
MHLMQQHPIDDDPDYDYAAPVNRNRFVQESSNNAQLEAIAHIDDNIDLSMQPDPTVPNAQASEELSATNDYPIEQFLNLDFDCTHDGTAEFPYKA